jgi:hypothetical protein
MNRFWAGGTSAISWQHRQPKNVPVKPIIPGEPQAKIWRCLDVRGSKKALRHCRMFIQGSF